MRSPTANTRTRRRLTIAGLILLALVFIGLAVSYGLRTSTYLKVRIGPRMDELGISLDGQFSFKQICAMGVTGIVLNDVDFQPNQPGASPIHFDAVTVYPALMGMFFGDLNASLIDISGLRASFNLENENTADSIWLHRLSERSETISSPDSPASAQSKTVSLGTLPAVRCQDCIVHAAVAENREIRIAAQDQTAELIASEQKLTLHGKPLSVCTSARTPDDSDETLCIQTELTGLKYRDHSLTIPNLTLREFSRSGVHVQALTLHNIEISRRNTDAFLSIHSGTFSGTIDEESPLSVFAGEYFFEFVQLELLHNSDKNRIGAGLTLRAPDTSVARLYGGFDLSTHKLAFTLDTEAFDMARFTHKLKFSKDVDAAKLPITGHADIIAELPEHRTWINADFKLTDASVTSAMIARDPIHGIHAQLSFNAWIDGTAHSVFIDNAKGSLGKLPFEFTLARYPNDEGGYSFETSFASAGEAADFIPSLPQGFAPAITGYELRGPYSFRLGLAFSSQNYDELALDAEFNLDDVKTLAYDPRSDFGLLSGDAFMIRVNAATIPMQIGPRDPNWTRFYDLPRHTAYAFIASEDGKFFSHPGFDIRAIRSSLIANLKADKVVRGGSTISQQVVKNLFLNQDKTLSRKFQEAFLTWQMEKKLTKLRIFEFYLNLAHWGKDTYGIRAAAQLYFQKSVSQLTLRESLFLASILPNPIIFGRQYAQGQLSSSRLNKMINVGNALRSANRIAAVEWDEAIPLIKDGRISDRARPVIP